MTNAKVTLFSSSIMSLGLIMSLKQENKLAGVVVESNESHETQHLVHNLNHFGIPFTTYQAISPDTLLSQIKNWKSNLGLVFFFKQKISDTVIQFFDGNIINLHASELPDYRGSMPLYWQLRNNEAKTALTAHFLTDCFDAGDIVLQEPIAIHPYDNIQTLSETVLQKALPVVSKLIVLFESQKMPRTPQRQVTESDNYASALREKDQWVDWKCMSADDIVGASRARNPVFGGVMTRCNQAVFNILQCASVNSQRFSVPAGMILSIDKVSGLVVATKDKPIELQVVASQQGYFSGYSFAIRHGLDIGVQLQ
ncbi:hypothetical protein D210916BOD24_34040 [Alteromonas sp. D210916BOD_24]|uniref:methionyl-tRNA formyltransferase n=1 Tax=Alteromonas sp. D210916BOD_24 TaxID=3157618 RepID=UPI00399C4BBE